MYPARPASSSSCPIDRFEHVSQPNFTDEAKRLIEVSEVFIRLRCRAERRPLFDLTRRNQYSID
jgi:hypothetical protein